MKARFSTDIPAFVYVLEDPRDPGNIRYIGVSQSLAGRLTQHLTKARRGFEDPVYVWVRQLLVEQMEPRLRPLWQGHILEAGRKEREAIAGYKALGFNLLNVSSGGKGCPGMHGPRPAQSLAMKGRRQLADWVQAHGPANKGKPMSEAQRLQLSESKKGKSIPQLHTPAAHAKAKASWTPERRAAQAARMQGNKRQSGRNNHGTT